MQKLSKYMDTVKTCILENNEMQLLSYIDRSASRYTLLARPLPV